MLLYKSMFRPWMMMLLMAAIAAGCGRNAYDPATKTIIDADGNTYKTAQIDGKIWMAENLNVSRYRNGDSIRFAKTAEEWLAAHAKKEGAWCYYGNDPKNGKIYGKLYNWYAVNDPRGLAPQGWHVPADQEWEALAKAVGGASVAGSKLKAKGVAEYGTGLWRLPNYEAEDAVGFAGLPGGTRNSLGAFNFMGIYGSFWTSTDYSEGYAWYRTLYCNASPLDRFGNSKVCGYSVRCMKD